MTPSYAAQLGFKVQMINVGARKIDKFSLEIYSIVIVAF